MTDESKLLAERERAHLARQVIDNPVWQDAWTRYEETLKAHMLEPKSTDETVLVARQGILLMKRVRTHIEKAMETGKLAELQLESIHGRNSRDSEH